MAYLKEEYSKYLFENGIGNPGNYCYYLDCIENWFNVNIDDEYLRDGTRKLSQTIQEYRSHPEVLNKKEIDLRNALSKLKRYCEFKSGIVREKNIPKDKPNVIEKPKRYCIGKNIILYGIPGCGKSYTIKTQYCNDAKYMHRVVFHPDYTYSDFIGQILPTINKSKDGKDKITYEFIPGPFTEALSAAVNDEEQEMHYLIIEEINRGNAPAIFGEVFQLLDRENGISEYGITHFDIAEYVYCDKSQQIKLPSNLTILATMNTADQNVFTLDTAFKRRWIMKNVENSFDNCAFAKKSICNSNISWQSFVEIINSKIVEFAKDSIGSEDARIGAFFVKEDELISAELFADKVLMYLWNDAFKYNREKIFKSDYSTLESLIKGFKNNGFNVFIDDLLTENS